MAREQSGIPVERDAARRADAVAGAEPSIGDLFRQLSNDTSELVRQEIALAKVEMRETGSKLAQDATRVGIGLGLALAGALALTAFLVAGLGRLLGGHYWLSALIIGVIFVAVGALLAKGAMKDIKARGVTPDQTMQSLRDDALWAKREAKEVRREMTT